MRCGVRRAGHASRPGPTVFARSSERRRLANGVADRARLDRGAPPARMSGGERRCAVVGWLGLDGRSQDGRVVLIGHRADPERGEENTAAGVRSAASDAPVGAVEIDVCVVGGVPVVAHDQRAARRRAEPLERVLAAASLGVMVDLKDSEAGPAVAARNWPSPDRLLYVGNPDAVVAIAEARVPGHRGLTWEEPTYPEEWLDQHGASVLNLGWWCVRAEVVARAHAAGKLVTAWTVDDVDLAWELARLGVDAIVTNVPRELARGLGPALRAPERHSAVGEASEPVEGGRPFLRHPLVGDRPSGLRMARRAVGRRWTGAPGRVAPGRGEDPSARGGSGRLGLVPLGPVLAGPAPLFVA